MIVGSAVTYCLSRGKVFSWCLAAVAMASLSVCARAASIVTDGGFESAGANGIHFAGQSLDGGAWNVTQGEVYVDTQDPYVYAGNNSLNLTYVNLYTPNSVSQVLATVVGQTYGVSFYADADTANTFSFMENGLAIAGTPTSIAANGFPNAANSALFTDYLGSFVASSAATTLNLTATANPGIGSQDGSVMIDNVSVQAAAAVTPEPASFGLVLTGMAGLGAMIRRRRQDTRSRS